MQGEKDSFLVTKIISSQAEIAYSFHRRIADDDSHIWPRTREQVEKFTREGQLSGVWQDGDLVAFAYVVLDGNAWEFGGLATAESVQGSGIGTLLTRFALAHNIVYEDPFSNDQEIIAHVHESNQKPRNILERVGFRFVEQIDVTDIAPESMKRNASGRVVGDRFRFTIEGLLDLADWFNNDFDGTLGRGKGAVTFDLGPANLDYLKEALRQIADSSGASD